MRSNGYKVLIIWEKDWRADRMKIINEIEEWLQVELLESK